MITLHGVLIRLVRVTQTTISFELQLREGVHLEIILSTKERGVPENNFHNFYIFKILSS